MASLEQTINAMKNENFKKFASDQEKRTRELMSAVERYNDKVSAENASYMDALRGIIEQSGTKSAGELKASVQQIRDLQNVINAQADITKQDRQTLNDVAAMTEKRLKDDATWKKRLAENISEKLSSDAIDVTGAVNGITGGSPMVAKATAFLQNKMKESAKKKKEDEKAAAEEAVARLEGIDAAKQTKKNAEVEAQLMKDKAAAGLGGGAAALASDTDVASSELVVWNEMQAEYLEKIWSVMSETNDMAILNSKDNEENRREQYRQQERLIEAIEDIDSAELDVKGGDGSGGGFLSTLGTLLGSFFGTGLAGMLSSLTGLFGANGTLAKAISGTGRLAAQAIRAVGPIAAVGTAIGMAAKDAWDIASAAFDDDITTQIQGEDIGGVTGSALGAVIGGAIGSVVPGIGTVIGASLGSIVGNMAGEFIGGTLAPNYEEVFAESTAQIMQTKDSLRASLTNLDNLLQTGAITQEDYDAQRAVIDSQLAMNDQFEKEAEYVQELNNIRLGAGQRYNELAANIRQMEEDGIPVAQSMYDALEATKEEYDSANEAFEMAAEDLQAKVDPSWYQSLSATMMASWDMLSGAASSAWDTLSTTFESARGWFADKIVALDNAFGISETVKSAVEYVEDKASELAGVVAETVSEAAQAVDEAVTSGLATVGLDDEYQATKEAVADAAQAVADTAQQVAEGVQNLADSAIAGTNFEDGVDLSDVAQIGSNLGGMAVEGAQAAAEAVGDAVTGAIDAVGLTDEVQAVADFAQETIEQASDLIESGKEIISETVTEGIEKLGLEEEVEWVEDQLEAAGDALSEVSESIGDAIGSMTDSVSGWFSSWWDDSSSTTPSSMARGNVPDAAAQGLRPGNAHTEIAVNSGDAATRRDALLRQMDEQGISDPTMRAQIMAQAHHETGGFRTTEENFNYSGRRLFELYGAGNTYGNRVRFQSVDEANALVARGQSAVGDVIYGGRMGNTDEGDGFKYRGRGAFQLTGRDNYRRYGEMIGVDLEANPELVNDPEIGAKVALAYYQQNIVNRGIDSGDTRAVSRAINGGTIGLQDRMDLFASYNAQGVPSASGALTEAQQALTVSEAESSTAPAPVIVQNGGTSVAMGGAGGGGSGGAQPMSPVGTLSPEEILMIYGGNPNQVAVG